MYIPSLTYQNHAVARPASPVPSNTVHHEFRLRPSSTTPKAPAAYQARVMQMANLIVQLPAPPVPYGSVVASKLMLTKTPTNSDVARDERTYARDRANSRP